MPVTSADLSCAELRQASLQATYQGYEGDFVTVALKNNLTFRQSLHRAKTPVDIYQGLLRLGCSPADLQGCGGFLLRHAYRHYGYKGVQLVPAGATHRTSLSSLAGYDNGEQYDIPDLVKETRRLMDASDFMFQRPFWLASYYYWCTRQITHAGDIAYYLGISGDHVASGLAQVYQVSPAKSCRQVARAMRKQLSIGRIVTAVRTKSR